MKRIVLTLSLFLSFAVAIYWLLPKTSEFHPSSFDLEEEEELKPDDWLFNQRAYPHNHIDIPAYRSAVQQHKRAQRGAALRNANDWEQVGPLNTGGRVTDLLLHPTNPDIIYVGASAGGIFKTENGGNTWEAIFDESNSLSIGDLAMAPSNPDILYAGTGEANASATSGAFFGDGIYKSLNGGSTTTRPMC